VPSRLTDKWLKGRWVSDIRAHTADKDSAVHSINPGIEQVYTKPTTSALMGRLRSFASPPHNQRARHCTELFTMHATLAASARLIHLAPNCALSPRAHPYSLNWIYGTPAAGKILHGAVGAPANAFRIFSLFAARPHLFPAYLYTLKGLPEHNP
jgi:hypothetical protein